jgi:predicted flap endonuclease-1-like 5' DNA nuclease
MARLETVRIVAPEGHSGPFITINERDFDPEEHVRYEPGAAAPGADAEALPLAEVVGTREAKALARGGVHTLAEAEAAGPDVLDAIDGVGPATVRALAEAIEATRA